MKDFIQQGAELSPGCGHINDSFHTVSSLGSIVTLLVMLLSRSVYVNLFTAVSLVSGAGIFCHQGCYPELIVRRLVCRFGAGER
jgi:hypothetical protein